MKITNFAIIFTIIISTFLVNLYVDEKRVTKAQDLTVTYDQALSSAVLDGSRLLLTNVQQEYESGYESLKFTRVNREEAINTFYKTLSLNFNIADKASLGVLKAYIPVILIVDYQGFYIYAMDEFRNDNNELVSDFIEMPYTPYAYQDSEGNRITFSLDDYVIAYDKTLDVWKEGFREEIAGDLRIPLLNDEELFENMRRTTIINALQKDLEYYIYRHNTFAKRFGVDYTFTLPILSAEDWNNTIDDIGMLSFIQGFPLGGGHIYNNFGFSGGRIKKSDLILTTKLNGIKYYYRESCGFNYPTKEVFTNEKDAAKSGYHPLTCINK